MSDNANAPNTLLLDIEGTTTPIAFVHRVLFPYARARMADYLQAHWEQPDIQADRVRLEAEYRAEAESWPDLPPWNAEDTSQSALSYLLWLTDRDRKSPALKSLQGKIWQHGYETGAIQGQVYADVPPFLKAWRAQGGKTYIYSSGSVLAQQLLFRHSDHGDLTPLLDGYFDTGVGPKKEARSYTAIAQTLAVAPASLLFVSDLPEELAAAQTAGLPVALSVREDSIPEAASPYPIVRDFHALIRKL